MDNARVYEGEEVRVVCVLFIGRGAGLRAGRLAQVF